MASPRWWSSKIQSPRGTVAWGHRPGDYQLNSDEDWEHQAAMAEAFYINLILQFYIKSYLRGIKRVYAYQLKMTEAINRSTEAFRKVKELLATQEPRI